MRGVYDAILSIIQLFGDSMHYDGHVQARCKVASILFILRLGPDYILLISALITPRLLARR